MQDWLLPAAVPVPYCHSQIARSSIRGGAQHSSSAASRSHQRAGASSSSHGREHITRSPRACVCGCPKQFFYPSKTEDEVRQSSQGDSKGRFALFAVFSSVSLLFAVLAMAMPGPAVSTRARAALGDISNRGLAGGAGAGKAGVGKVRTAPCAALQLSGGSDALPCHILRPALSRRRSL